MLAMDASLDAVQAVSIDPDQSRLSGPNYAITTPAASSNYMKLHRAILIVSPEM